MPQRSASAPSLTHRRRLVAALALQGTSHGIAIPVLPAYLTHELGGPVSAGIILVMLSAGAGAAANTAIGYLSDRYWSRPTIAAICALWLALGSFLMPFATQFWSALLIGVVFMSFFQIPAAQIFALGQELAEDDEAALSRVGALRIAYIMGWVAGPAIGGTLMSILPEMSDVFVVQASCYLAAAAVMHFIARVPKGPSVGTVERPGFFESLHLVPSGLWPLLIGICLLMAGDTTRAVLLPLILTDHLGAAAWEVGVAMSILPVAEVPVLLLVLAAVRRFGTRPVLIFSSLAGAIFFFGVQGADSVLQVCFAHAAYAFVPAAALSVGLFLVQKMEVKRPGLATSLVFSAQQMALFCGGLLAIAAVEGGSLTAPFYLFALFCIAASLCFARILNQKISARKYS